ncbi:hypothetical protein [Plantactinospora soyae]|uniref:Uncharacterized protein n=1 Tax=Plantactinospora soyae TaxID=1544732 RepID=A0A927M2J1_9ACTN|nr:hypothetical protein [Plantactinospora soyae]MBE1484388.1 hypothetical protein [Plantactinospora soyae]
MMSYELVAGTGDLRLAEELIRAGVVGNPERTAADQPDALPWLAFVPGKTAQVLACVETGWTEAVDGTGQPIAPVKLVYLPYSDATVGLPTCQSLSTAVHGLRWSGVDQPPADLTGDGRIVLDLAPGAVDTLIAAVAHCGFEWAATVAAVLLDGGTVAIVAAIDQFPGPDERIVALDAVFALLPYWYRTALSAATWTSPRAAHAIRLSFTSRAGSEQTEVGWRVPVPEPQLRTQDAVAYLEELCIAARDPEIGTAGVVRHLAERRQPPADSPQSHALNDLREVRLAEMVHHEVNRGYGHPLRVDNVLARGWQLLDGVKRRDFTCFLLDRAGRPDELGVQAVDVLRRRWVPDMLDILLERTRTALSARDLALVRRHLDEVHRLAPPSSGTADQLFQRLLARDRGADPAVLLDLLFDPPDGIDAQAPGVARALLRWPDLYCRYLERLLRSDAARIVGHLTGLERAASGDVPGWFRPFIAVAQGDMNRARPEDRDSLVQIWPEAGGTLLEIAELRGVTNRMFGFVWPALVRSVGLSLARTGSAPPVPTFIPLNGRDTAKADLLNLLILGAMPALALSPAEPPADYLDGLRVGWSDAAFADHRASRVRPLVDIIGGEPGPARVAKLCAVGNAIDDDRVTAAITDALADEVARARPRWLNLSVEWARRIANLGRLRHFWPLYQLAGLTRIDGTDITALAGTVRQAAARGAGLDEILPMLATWLARQLNAGTPESIVRDMVSEISRPEPPISQLGHQIGIAILQGRAGPELANAFGRVIETDVRNANVFSQLRAAATAPPQHHAPAVRTTDRISPPPAVVRAPKVVHPAAAPGAPGDSRINRALAGVRKHNPFKKRQS